MVNSLDFSKRIEKIMSHYDLSASAFADKIGVGRSSISHIVSGRNKPSLDFIMKILEVFPEINLYWLMNGSGEFIKNSGIATSKKMPSSPIQNPKPENPVEKIPDPITGTLKSSSVGKEIARVIIFYTDGSFEAFEKNEVDIP